MTKILTFKNNELVPVANFLIGLDLKNKASRGRTKLVKLLAEKNSEFQKELTEETDKFLLKDENGDKVPGEDEGTFKTIEGKALEANTVKEEISNEEAVIEFTEYSEKFAALRGELNSYDRELNGQDATIYDLLMETFENNDEEKGNN